MGTPERRPAPSPAKQPGPAREGRRPGGALAARVALVASVFAGTLASVWLFPRGSAGQFVAVHGPAQMALVLGALAAFGVLLAMELRTPTLPRRAVVALGILLALGTALAPSRDSADIGAYLFYGRILTVYHANPYLVAPAAFPHDPFFSGVAPLWRHQPALYGPLFVGVSAAVAASPLGASSSATALAFQLIEALAVAAALLLLSRRVRSSAPLVLVGLNPLIAAVAVNGGHPDPLVGLAVLGGVLLAERDRPVAAGLALGAGALLKVTALFPAVAIALWLWRRRGPRPAAASLGAAGLLGLGGTLAARAGGALTGRVMSGLTAHYSPWLAPVWTAAFVSGRGAERILHIPGWYHGHLQTLAMLATLALAALLTLPRLGEESPAPAAGAAGLATMLMGAWVLPWYVGLPLPVLALEPRSRAARAGLAVGALTLVGYVAQSAVHAGLHILAGNAVMFATSALGLALAIALAVRPAPPGASFRSAWTTWTRAPATGAPSPSRGSS